MIQFTQLFIRNTKTYVNINCLISDWTELLLKFHLSHSQNFAGKMIWPWQNNNKKEFPTASQFPS